MPIDLDSEVIIMEPASIFKTKTPENFIEWCQENELVDETIKKLMAEGFTSLKLLAMARMMMC